MVALMALGVRPGDEILVPSFYICCFRRAYFSLYYTVFVNVDERTFNFDLDDAKQRITDKTVGMVVASLYGQCADYHSINHSLKK